MLRIAVVKQSLQTEIIRLGAQYSRYHLYHLILSTKNTEADGALLKVIVKSWRSFCDVQCIRFLCYDSDGTEHLHVVIWSALQFQPEFYPKFRLDFMQLGIDSFGWKSQPINGYSVFCLRRHSSLSNLAQYILSERNFNRDHLKKSNRHFYAASRGVDTSLLNRIFREFYALSASVRRSTDQLGIILARYRKSQEWAESTEAFLRGIFSIFRDDPPGRRSNEENKARRRSRLPVTERLRLYHYFKRYEYDPSPMHIISLVLAQWSDYDAQFQARLIPKLLYDGVCNLWARNTALSMPPPPLEDFYSDDFLGLGSRDLSYLLPKSKSATDAGSDSDTRRK